MIFVDTSFWAATTSRRDGHHDEAVLLLERHARDPLLTSNHVVGETWSFLRRRHGHRQAVAGGFQQRRAIGMALGRRRARQNDCIAGKLLVDAANNPVQNSVVTINFNACNDYMRISNVVGAGNTINCGALSVSATTNASVRSWKFGTMNAGSAPFAGAQAAETFQPFGRWKRTTVSPRRSSMPFDEYQSASARASASAERCAKYSVR